MQTIAKRMAAVRTRAARTGETGTFITFDTPGTRQSGKKLL
jgi:hypothetical protein